MELEQKVKELYKLLKTPKEIGAELSVHPSKVRRILIKAGVTLRTKSESQKLALSSGKSVHPTKGKTLSESTKTKISERRSEIWQNMNTDDRQRLVDAKRQQWQNMSDEQKANLQSAAHVAIRESAVLGSKTERFLESALTEHGYEVILHPKNVIPNENLEIDLYLPQFKTAIEIDGPTHFLPIYGTTKLEKQQSADSRKMGLILNGGLCIIRVKISDKSNSKKRMNDVKNAILAEIDKIITEFPPEGKRLIELEVKNGLVMRL